jgi:hypothetical protein
MNLRKSKHRHFLIGLGILLTLALAFSGCKSDSESDDGTGGTSTCGNVAGTYAMTWTPGTDNDENCDEPDAIVEITADGLATGSPAGTCQSHSACSESNCDAMVLDSSCSAALTLIGPCVGLEDGRTISITSDFDNGTLTATTLDSDSPVGACSFTGVGKRQ